MWYLIGSVTLVVTLFQLAACSDSRTIDLCRRGDNTETPERFSLSFRDKSGSLLATHSASASDTTHLDFQIPDDSHDILATGLSGAGVPIAIGSGLVEKEGACICIAVNAQHPTACKDIRCQIDDNSACQFFEATTGNPVAERSLTIGSNSLDDIRSPTPDAFIRIDDGSQELNYGTSKFLEVGLNTNSLIRFDLSSLPSTTQILEASLTLHVDERPGSGTNQRLNIYKILEDWNEGVARGQPGCVNWNCRQDDLNWTTPGAAPPGSRDDVSLGAFVPLELATSYTTETNEPMNQQIEEWIKNPSQNFGFAATTLGNVCFVSSDGLDGLRPRLNLTYVIPQITP